MAHIPMGDIEELWKQNGSHNWSGLHQTLEEHRGKKQGISNTLVVEMLKISKNLEGSGQSYPSSAQELYNTLNEKLHANT